MSDQPTATEIDEMIAALATGVMIIWGDDYRCMRQLRRAGNAYQIEYIDDGASVVEKKSEVEVRAELATASRIQYIK
jgi:hypothetical protein